MNELRKDPLLNRWVIIATDRVGRPNDWPGRFTGREAGKPDNCPFCPGNEHHSPGAILEWRDSRPGQPGSPWLLRVVPNKFPALKVEVELKRRGVGMFDLVSGVGAHEVVIETPDHAGGFGELDLEQAALVFKAYRERLSDLMRDTRLEYVLAFKNEGIEAGASLSHPHSQIIAIPVLPKRVEEELEGAEAYFANKRRCVFCDMLDTESMMRDRLVYQNDSFIAFCPYASASPFETWVLPRGHRHDFSRTADADLPRLADAVQTVIRRWRKALGRVDYNFLVHTSPNPSLCDRICPGVEEHFHWHVEMFPRITSTAGFEWGTGFFINTTAPEEAARVMREAEV